MRRLRLVPLALVLLLGAAGSAPAQQEPARDSARADSARAEPAGADSSGEGDGDGLPSDSTLRLADVFFGERAPLQITLSANLRALRRQRGDDNPWREAVLTVPGGDGAPDTVRARVRTRGIFRLKNCDFPPLRLRVGRRARAGTALDGLRRPKLVSYCKDQDDYEQYILSEYVAYRIYELLTPISLRARLARITYADSATGRAATTRYGIVLEEEAHLAARLGGQPLVAHGAKPHNLHAPQSALLAVFQFLIGNTDWSVQGLHNIVLVQTVENVFPVAYDFDFAGLVKARYAAPDPRMGITTVTQRRYRGTCQTVGEVQGALELVRARREAIYAALAGTPGLQRRNADRMREYLDDFFELIADPNRVRREIVERCIAVN